MRMKLVEDGTLWRPTKALYGFRKSPKLWGNHRGAMMRKMVIPHQQKRYHLTQLVSEPNLWRLDEVKEDEEAEEKHPGHPKAVMMVYVDDLFAVGPTPLLNAMTETIKKKWNTSTPESIHEDPTRFLGMGITKAKDEDGLDVWAAAQQNYMKDLLRRYVGEEEKKWPKRKIPMAREMPQEKQEEVRPDKVRQAQKAVGEILWLMTRTVSRMTSQTPHKPQWVMTTAEHLWGSDCDDPRRDHF
eukprot:s1049_g23.t1